MFRRLKNVLILGPGEAKVEFKKRLEAKLIEQVSPQDLVPKITVDAYLELGEANSKLLDDMAQLEPFGNQNPQPSFIIKNVTLMKQPTLLKDKHVKAMIFADGILKPIIFFNRPDIFKYLSAMHDQPFHIVGNVTKNEWQGTVRIELQGIDIAI